MDIEGSDSPSPDSLSPLLECTSSGALAKLPVYARIHSIRHDIITHIYDPYSVEQLKAPRLNYSVLRPLVDRYYIRDDVSIIYCLLVNRMQFIREQSYRPHWQTVGATRAILCELLAIRILRRFDEDNPGRQGLLLLGHILISGFEPFQNAPEDVLQDHRQTLPWALQDRGGYERKLSALEVAIISESKGFLSSVSVQMTVDAIYKGQLIFTPISFIDILPDHYKHKPITLYDPRQAPLLNQYRMVVPRTRNLLEIGQFMILLYLYLLVMTHRSPTFDAKELAFCIYTLGWLLDQFATILEHGWRVYTQNLWSFIDVFFAVIFFTYLVLRIWMPDSVHAGFNVQAIDVLATAAPFLIPRLAFVVMHEHMLFVSLRALMKDFMVLTFLAVWCFGGFLLSMSWLANGAHQSLTITKWLIWIWFGLDGTGFDKSFEFHWLLGPSLMTAFAFLGNTLFLTVLVAMLSSTFGRIVNDANAEIQFRRTVLTFEGVKSDAIFAYQPPFNLVALVVLLPLKFFVSPRWFHKINVTAVRILNAPLLLFITWYERRSLWLAKPGQTTGKVKRSSKFALWKLSVHSDIEAVFEFDPPPPTLSDLSPDHEDVEGRPQNKRSRRDSTRFLDHDLGPFPELGHSHHLSQRLDDRVATMEESLRNIQDLLQGLANRERTLEDEDI